MPSHDLVQGAQGLEVSRGLTENSEFSQGSMSKRSISHLLKKTCAINDLMQGPEMSRQTSRRSEDVTVHELQHAQSLYKSIEEIRSSLDKRDQSLRAFMQEELESMRASLSAEIQASTQRQESQQDHHKIRMPSWVEELESRLVALTGNVLEKLSAQHLAEVVKLNSISQDMSQDVAVQSRKTKHIVENVLAEAASGEQVTQPAQNEQGSDEALKERSSWQIQELEKEDSSSSWVELSFQHSRGKRTLPELILHCVGMLQYMPTDEPKNCFTPIARVLATIIDPLAITLNTIYVAHRADSVVQRKNRGSGEEDPAWWTYADLGFQIYFIAELLFRMFANGGWFWVSPHSWKWNVFDFCLVVLDSFLYMAGEIDLAFLRTLRVLRVIRMARFIRVVWGCNALRKLLLAVISCLSSLIWAGIFISFLMLMFAILILQAIGESPHYQKLEALYFDGLTTSLKTLLTVVVGPEWLHSHEVLSQLGGAYFAIMPLFVLFVNIGVLNIVVGVFSEAATQLSDIELIADCKISELDDFMHEMQQLFRDMAPKELNWRQLEVDKEVVLEYFHREQVQAYLSSHKIDASHAKLIFSLCDVSMSGTVSLHEFSTRLFRLKDQAAKIDSIIMMNTLQGMVQSLDSLRHEVMHLQTGTQM